MKPNGSVQYIQVHFIFRALADLVQKDSLDETIQYELWYLDKILTKYCLMIIPEDVQVSLLLH